VAPRAVSAWADQNTGEWGALGADLHSVFDLGSITKPCVAILAGLAEELGALRLDEPIGKIISEAAGSNIETVPLRSLLRHESGLIAHFRFYSDSWSGKPLQMAGVLRRLSHMVRHPRGGTVYSDLGYILVGRALEIRMREPLDHLLTRHVFSPLGAELGSARAFAARDGVHFVETEVQPARGGLLRGQVHDDNAWALSGVGASGHAGLFGSLSGVICLGRALLDGWRRTGPLSSVVPKLLQEPSAGGFSCGFMHPTGPKSSAGTLAALEAFGHLGFPGTSFWCDPVRGVVGVLLTNRVFPRRSPFPGRKTIQDLRREHHDYLWARGPERVL
jgi:serine-type D-Ala-D-Ala carboxypeptidase